MRLIYKDLQENLSVDSTQIINRPKEIKMVDNFIDTIQNYKKSFVSTYITDKGSRDALNKFVDAQTEFTKQSFKTAEYFGKEVQNQFQKMGFKSLV